MLYTVAAAEAGLMYTEEVKASSVTVFEVCLLVPVDLFEY